jgi:hypothetical protein
MRHPLVTACQDLARHPFIMELTVSEFARGEFSGISDTQAASVTPPNGGSDLGNSANGFSGCSVTIGSAAAAWSEYVFLIFFDEYSDTYA